MAKSSDGYKPTVFPNGTGLKSAWCGGGTAGDHTIDSSFGVEAGDLIQQAVQLDIDTDGTLATAVDLTSEFTRVVASANTVSNSGGTNTTDCILAFLIQDVDARE